MSAGHGTVCPMTADDGFKADLVQYLQVDPTVEDFRSTLLGGSRGGGRTAAPR